MCARPGAVCGLQAHCPLPDNLAGAAACGAVGPLPLVHAARHRPHRLPAAGHRWAGAGGQGRGGREHWALGVHEVAAAVHACWRKARYSVGTVTAVGVPGHRFAGQGLGFGQAGTSCRLHCSHECDKPARPLDSCVSECVLTVRLQHVGTRRVSTAYMDSPGILNSAHLWLRCPCPQTRSACRLRSPSGERETGDG